MAAVVDDAEDEDEEAVLQRALMMSTADNQMVTAGGPTPGAPVVQNPLDQQQEFKNLLQDNEFLQDIAKDLGIDNIDGILGGGASDQAKKEEDEKKKKEEEDKK